jgi:hypothetical protein
MNPSDSNQQLKTKLIEQLKEHKKLKGMKNYGETDADIDAYIKKLEKQ